MLSQQRRSEHRDDLSCGSVAGRVAPSRRPTKERRLTPSATPVKRASRTPFSCSMRARLWSARCRFATRRRPRDATVSRPRSRAGARSASVLVAPSPQAARTPSQDPPRWRRPLRRRSVPGPSPSRPLTRLDLDCQTPVPSHRAVEIRCEPPSPDRTRAQRSPRIREGRQPRAAVRFMPTGRSPGGTALASSGSAEAGSLTSSTRSPSPSSGATRGGGARTSTFAIHSHPGEPPSSCTAIPHQACIAQGPRPREARTSAD